MVFVKTEPREILQIKWEQVAGTCRKITMWSINRHFNGNSVGWKKMRLVEILAYIEEIKNT
jgi:hypothetical protein